MWPRASQRDKDRSIRILSELRTAQTNDYALAGRRLVENLSAAHAAYQEELRRIDKQLDQIESLGNTILNDGSNLGAELTNRERRVAVDHARKQLDEILNGLEARRLRRHMQATCKHTWRPTQLDQAPDGRDMVVAGVCSNCDAPLPIPSDAHIELEKQLNSEDHVKEGDSEINLQSASRESGA